MKYELTRYDDEGEVANVQEFRHYHQLLEHLRIPSSPLNSWGANARDLAMEKGFGAEDTPQMAVCRIALMHQELSELLEELRRPEPKMSTKCPFITAEAEELADVFLRLVQYAAIRGVDLDLAVQQKHTFNASRPHKHGKNF